MIDFSKKLPPDASMTAFHEWALGELQETCSPNTLKEYRTFMRHWVRLTNDPPLRDVTRDDLLSFRDRLMSESWVDDSGRKRNPVSPRTYLKLEGTFRHFADKARMVGLIDEVPQLYLFRKTGLPPAEARQTVKAVRDLIDGDDLLRLFRGSDFAKYPRTLNRRRIQVNQADRSQLWRALFYFAWTLGLRIGDFSRLTWECFEFQQHQCGAPGMILFRPWKLRRKDRLQGLPLTDFGIQLLQSLPRFDGVDDRVFPFLSKPGNWNQPVDGSEPHWIEGYASCLQRDICATQGIVPTIGPDTWIRSIKSRSDSRPPLTPHVFRQTMITELNDYSSNTGRRIGRFVAGQTGGAVDERSYDKPDSSVWEAIAHREATALPDCFRSMLA